MKQIGSLIGLFGIAAIIFGFMDRVPSLLQWIYKWGDGTAWAIKIGMVVVGGALYFMGRKNETT
jgi:hypothetical protein